jgi:predicted DNA-binding mobile mystery protein A
MSKLNEFTLNIADKKMEALRAVKEQASIHPGWISFVRKALGMSFAQLAKRAGVQPQTAWNAEKNEADEKITIERLRSYAEAMNCDLVYGFVPRRPIREQMREEARLKAIDMLNESNVHMSLEGQGSENSEFEIGKLTQELLGNPKKIWD